MSDMWSSVQVSDVSRFCSTPSQQGKVMGHIQRRAERTDGMVTFLAFGRTTILPTAFWPVANPVTASTQARAMVVDDVAE